MINKSESEIASDHAHASIMNGLHICLMNTIMTPTIQLNQWHKAAGLPSFPITLSNLAVFKPPVLHAYDLDCFLSLMIFSLWQL